MFPALLAAIPALMSLFGGAGAATAGAAGAGAAGGAAGGLGGLLGGLFGGASGGAAAGGAATTAAEALPELAGAGSSGGFLGGAPAAGAPSGGMGGIFGQLLGQGGGGQQQGGGGNMMNDLLGGPGRAYMVGAQAGKGDFKGAQQMMDQHTAAVNQTNRTGLLANEDKRRGEQFDLEKQQLAKREAANAKIAGVFENPDTFKDTNSMTQALGSVLGPMLESGNHAGAGKVFDLLAKAQTDKKTEAALGIVNSLVQKNRDPKTKELNIAGLNSDIEAFGNKDVNDAYKGVLPHLSPELTQGNQKRVDEDRDASRARMEQESIRNQGNSDRMFGLAVAQGNRAETRMSAMEERNRIQEETQKRLAPSQLKILTQQRNAVDNIDAFEKAYDDMAKENKGKVSPTLKGWLAKNPNAQTLADISGKISPAERTFAATVLSTRGNLRSLSDEVGVFTKEDENRILASYDPTMTPAQVKENLKAVRQRHERVYGNYKQDYEATGKDVSKLSPDLKRQPKQKGDANQAEIDAAKKRLGLQ